jgi:preprotein translocase subunit SecG
MVDILITAGLFLLIIISLFLILVVLMQRANTNAGLGAAFGGGLTESAFGTEAGNIMSRTTWIGSILFFVLGFSLYLAILAQRAHSTEAEEMPLFDETPAAVSEETPAPAQDLQPATPETVPLPESGQTAPAAQ